MIPGSLTIVGPTCTPDEIDRVRKESYLPGECVRHNLGGPARNIETTIVRAQEGPPDDRVLNVTYVFEGDAREHDREGYEDAWGHRHHYGAVTMRNDRMWLVPTDDKGIPEADAMEIVGVRGRYIGGDENADDTFEYLKRETGLGSEGEFVVHPTEMDGDYRQVLLGGIPWWSRASQEIKALAQAAVLRVAGSGHEADPDRRT